MDIRSFFSPFSQAFLTIAEDILLEPNHYTLGTARENIIKALDGFNNAITLYRENPIDLFPLNKVGGTALRSDEQQILVDAPYLDLAIPGTK